MKKIWQNEVLEGSIIALAVSQCFGILLYISISYVLVSVTTTCLWRATKIKFQRVKNQGLDPDLSNFFQTDVFWERF